MMEDEAIKSTAVEATNTKGFSDSTGHGNSTAEEQSSSKPSTTVDNGGKQRDRGRNEYNRQLTNEKRKRKKEQKANDWRDWKRRKTDKFGNEYLKETKNPFSKEEIASEERRPKRKVAVMIGYAGTGYRGMQLNGDDKTIERDLFQAFIDTRAISKANADDARKSSLSRCARTDKGVHAAGNVISLKLIIEEEDILQKINAALPDQIRVWGIQRTNNSYNCYQYCDSRWYEYLMPSYALLPPHPKTFLGQKLAELTKEYNAEEQVYAKLADVKDFWQDLEEKEIKPLLAKLDPHVRAQVAERIFSDAEEDESAEANEPEKTAADVEKKDGTHDAETAVAEQLGKTTPQDHGVKLTTTKPRHRELNAVDMALRDIKIAYIAAKRRYRITPERLNQLQAVLNEYQGTHNFHNYTVQKPFTDPSAKRLIKSFVVNPNPIIINNTEWLSLKVHGQSFMMHQIRKMVGLASLMVRCGTPLERVAESYQKTKMAIPKAPGLGLLLERPVFSNYNRRARDSLGREEINFDKYETEMEKFKQEQIYTRIFDVEEKENWFHGFYNQIDQFKANHFLWLTAGGMAIADFTKGSGEGQDDINKKLGDEDEDPEGGEG